MKKWKHTLIFTIMILVFIESTLLAAPRLSRVRFGSRADRDRIVLDLSALPKYSSVTEDDGAKIIITLDDIADFAKIKPAAKSDMIRRISYAKSGRSLIVTIELEEAAEYEIKTLKNPVRLLIDIKKLYESEEKNAPLPGLLSTKYTRKDTRGLLTAYLLDVDLQKFDIIPVLANGEVLGRDTVSSMAGDMNAVAAINASYFAPDGEILGVMRMDGTTVGTTYFKRSALGIRRFGVPFVSTISYSGMVTVGKVSRYVSGVNAARGDNALIVYNNYYDNTTNTNEYGLELTVQNGKVTKIMKGNSPIPKNGFVISAHGSAKNAFQKVKVGDKATFTENMGAVWKNVPEIIGAGPALVKNGKVFVTAEREEFPGDISVGRAPRTGVAILSNRHVLLAVVDGRQASSIGATLTEFAELLIKFGAREAINFDGGGSSEMVINGETVNSPSDGTERKVGSALAVIKKR